MKLLIVLAAVLFVSCHRQARLYDPVYKPGYVYVQVAPREFHVVADSPKLLDSALHDIGCGICTVEPVGTYYIVSKPN